MPGTYYLDSNATGANDGSSWADAYTSINNYEARTSPNAEGGDVVFCAYNHVDTGLAGVLDQSFGNSPQQNLVQMVSIDPATGLYRRGASFTASGVMNVGFATINQSGSFWYGCDLAAAAGSNIDLKPNTPHWFLDCKLSGADILVGQDSKYFFSDVELNISGNITPSIPQPICGSFSLGSGTTGVTYLFNTSTIETNNLRENADLLNASAGMTFLAPGANPTNVAGPCDNRLAQSRLPATYSFPGRVPTEIASVSSMFNCSSSAVLHGLAVSNYNADFVDDTTVYRNGRIGGTPVSIRYTSATSSRLSKPMYLLLGEFYADANPTITVHLTSDDTLDASEVWLEISHPTSGAVNKPKFYWGRDHRWATSGTPATLTTESATWTGGKTNKYKLETTLTGGAAGAHRVYLWCGVEAAAKTLYVDPRIDTGASGTPRNWISSNGLIQDNRTGYMWPTYRGFVLDRTVATGGVRRLVDASLVEHPLVG